MKKILRILSFCLIFCMAGFKPACAEAGETADFAGSVRLMNSADTARQEVTVKTFIDGDTTHFFVPETVMESGVLKARYLAVNTPEITGKVEEYGKKAAAFTKEKLSEAVSIVIESDNGSWNKDSTGDRYLVWVWYKTEENGQYRNLNIELLENGLAIANSSASNRYGDTCMNAIAYAKAQKLNIYSGQKDPDFYYGDAIELTVKELRSNLEAYNGKKVAFSGVITMNSSMAVYVEDYDPETDLYYGISVYYGYGMSGKGLDILSVGNEARIVGTVQFYEAGGTWQVSGLTYRMMKPNDPGNIQKLSDGHQPSYVPVTAGELLKSSVTIVNGEDTRVFDRAYLAVATSVEMKDLLVESIYTTTDEESSSYGAMTMTCLQDGECVRIRTNVLFDASGSRITEDEYLGKTIDVRGIVDYFEGEYQIRVFMPSQITVHE